MVIVSETLPIPHQTVPQLSLSHEELELIVKLLQENEQKELAEKCLTDLEEAGYTEPIKSPIMAFKDFKDLPSIKKTFGISIRQFHLFPEIELVEPTAKLSIHIKEGLVYAPISEKERSESLLYPILSSVKAMSDANFDLYSGRHLNVDKSKGLRGECDFLYAFSDVRDYVETPIFAAIEAKETMIRQGTAQCAAQMIGIKHLNEQEETPLEMIYGCVTNGYDWRFMRLKDKELVIDTQVYDTKKEIAEILGIWKKIVEDCRPQNPQL